MTHVMSRRPQILHEVPCKLLALSAIRREDLGALKLFRHVMAMQDSEQATSHSRQSFVELPAALVTNIRIRQI